MTKGPLIDAVMAQMQDEAFRSGFMSAVKAVKRYDTGGPTGTNNQSQTQYGLYPLLLSDGRYTYATDTGLPIHYDEEGNVVMPQGTKGAMTTPEVIVTTRDPRKYSSANQPFLLTDLIDAGLSTVGEPIGELAEATLGDKAKYLTLLSPSHVGRSVVDLATGSPTAPWNNEGWGSDEQGQALNTLFDLGVSIPYAKAAGKAGKIANKAIYNKVVSDVRNMNNGYLNSTIIPGINKLDAKPIRRPDIIDVKTPGESPLYSKADIPDEIEVRRMPLDGDEVTIPTDKEGFPIDRKNYDYTWGHWNDKANEPIMNERQVFDKAQRMFDGAPHGYAISFDQDIALSSDSYPFVLNYLSKMQKEGKGTFVKAKGAPDKMRANTVTKDNNRARIKGSAHEMMQEVNKKIDRINKKYGSNFQKTSVEEIVPEALKNLSPELLELLQKTGKYHPIERLHLSPITFVKYDKGGRL